MPQFVIRIVNETFVESAKTELPHLDAAQAYAIKAAIEIGAEEVLRGEPAFLAEASVELDGEVLRAVKVTVAASLLRRPGTAA